MLPLQLALLWLGTKKLVLRRGDLLIVIASHQRGILGLAQVVPVKVALIEQQVFDVLPRESPLAHGIDSRSRPV